MTHSSTSNIPQVHSHDKKKESPHMDTLTLLLDAREKLREHHKSSLTAELSNEPLRPTYTGRSFEQEMEYLRWVKQELLEIPVDEDEVGNATRSDMETTLDAHTATSKDTTKRNSDMPSSSETSSSTSHMLMWQV